jgi:hypothetical protein
MSPDVAASVRARLLSEATAQRGVRARAWSPQFIGEGPTSTAPTALSTGLLRLVQP